LTQYQNASANWVKAGLLSVGGIPNRTTVCATVSPIGGGADDSTNINNAISNCPAGEVVSLSAGTFTIQDGNYIWINKGITVRGAGAGTTILTRTNGATLNSSNPGSHPSPMVALQPVCWNDCSNNTAATTALTADGTQGSYSVTVASASGFEAGQFVQIDELSGLTLQQDPEGFSNQVYAAGTYPDYELVYPDHSPGMSCDNANGSPPTDSSGPGQYFTNLNRFTTEIKYITNVSGNTITFDSPLTSNYRVSHTAELYASTTPYLQNAGVENLTVQYSDFGAINFSQCAYCWAKAVEVTLFLGQAGYGGVNFSSSFRSQLEGSYIHKVVWPYDGGNGYNISLNWGSSEILIENNISMLANKVDVVQASGAGSVFAYNYFDDGWDEVDAGGVWIETGMNGSHMIGSHHILFEGNETFNIDDDGTWGTAHYQTFLRNWATGFRAPFTDYANGNSAVNDLTNTPGGNEPYRALSAMRWAYNNAYLGNVLGTSGDMNDPSTWVYLGGVNSNPAEVMLGYDTCNGATDPEVAASATLDGNYDYLQNTVTWLPTDTTHTLPNSFYLSSAPSFFTGTACTYPWPPVTPNGSTPLPSPAGPSCKATDGIPAKARFDAGTPFVQP
jgi:hypothetical protein